MGGVSWWSKKITIFFIIVLEIFWLEIKIKLYMFINVCYDI